MACALRYQKASALALLRGTAQVPIRPLSPKHMLREMAVSPPVFYEIIVSLHKPCAAGFALLNLPKGKSLGRSKPETNSSNEQAHATHCVGFLLSPSSVELPYAKENKHYKCE